MFNTSISPIDGTQIGTPGQSGPRSNGYEGILNTPVFQTAGAVEYTDCFFEEE